MRFSLRIFSILLSLCVLLHTDSISAQTKREPQIRTSEIVTPHSLDADAATLLRKWHKGYATNEEEGMPCSKETSKDPTPSEMVFRDRIMRLPTTMNIPYNSLVREGIDVFLTRRRSLIPVMLSLGDYYFPKIETILDKYGLPLELKYLIIVESAMDPTAVSPVGASGLWQFMLPTAKAYGLTINSLIDERLDLIRSTDAAARHLKDLYRVYNDWFMAMAAYNCGMGTLNRAVYRAGGRTDFWAVFPFLPRETRSYVPLFIGAFYAMHYHVDHHLCPSDKSLPLATDTIHLHHSYSTHTIAKAAEVSHDLFMLLNPQFKKNSIPGHIAPCTIYLPLPAIGRLDRRLDSLSQEAQKKALLLASGVRESMESLGVHTTEMEGKESLESGISPLRYHTVQQGETLSLIAQKNGITVKGLMKANGIRQQHQKLKVGQKLLLPAKKKTSQQKKSKKKRGKRRRR